MLGITLALAKDKAALNITGTDSDTILTNLIQAVTSAWEREAGRLITIADYNEYIDSDDKMKRFRVKNWPISNTGGGAVDLDLYYDTDREYGATTLLTLADDYLVDQSTGWVKLLFTPDICFEAFKAHYNGGLASAAAGLLTIYPLISMEILKQVMVEYKRLPTLGQASVQVHGESVAVMGPLQLSDSFRSCARQYGSQVTVW